jgi:hypothetical protein
MAVSAHTAQIASTSDRQEQDPFAVPISPTSSAFLFIVIQNVVSSIVLSICCLKLLFDSGVSLRLYLLLYMQPWMVVSED